MDLRILPKPEAPKIRAPAFVLLNETRPGSRVQLFALRMDTDRRDLLHRMGLVEGRQMSVVYNDHKSRVVLSLDGELFLLGRRETPHIQVRVL